jgi:hypothetical protein
VLYVPGLKNKFISILVMEEKGFSITFQIWKVLIHTDKVIPEKAVIIGVGEGTLYRLQGNHVQDLVHDSDNLCNLWNKSLGHLHYKELPILRVIVIGLP